MLRKVCKTPALEGELAQAGGRYGREVRRIRFEDFVNHPQASKKLARAATCANGRQHWVPRSLLKTSDPWKGKMVILDTSDGSERVLTRPKAMAKVNVHVGNPIEADDTCTIWALQDEDERAWRILITPTNG